MNRNMWLIISALAVAFAIAACGGTIDRTESTVAATQTLVCSWRRDQQFDAYKTRNNILYANSVWGVGRDSVYATASTAANGYVAHWDGTAWTSEPIPFELKTALRLHATADGTVTLAAYDALWQLAVYRKSNGVWSRLDPPAAKALYDLWHDETGNLFLVGQNANDRDVIWQWNGAWQETPPPDVQGAYRLNRVRGPDVKHLFVTGTILDAQNSAAGGLLFAFDGQTWTRFALPSDCLQVNDLHGSPQSLFWTGMSQDRTAVIYERAPEGRVTRHENRLLNSYVPIWSPMPGRAVAVGFALPDDAGSALQVPLTATVIQKTADSHQSIVLQGDPPSELWMMADGTRGHLATLHDLYIADCAMR